LAHVVGNDDASEVGVKSDNSASFSGKPLPIRNIQFALFSLLWVVVSADSVTLYLTVSIVGALLLGFAAGPVLRCPRPGAGSPAAPTSGSGPHFTGVPQRAIEEDDTSAGNTQPTTVSPAPPAAAV